MKIKDTNFKFFVPLEMWENAFYSLFSEIQGINVEDFQVGMRGIDTEDVITETLQKAKADKQKGMIPILVFPIGSIFRYCEQTNKMILKNAPKIRIIGPAFKSRDDIFLFIGKDKLIAEKKIKVVKKADDLTTTAIASLYKTEVIDKLCDPIFNEHHFTNTALKWQYSLEFVSNSIDEIRGNNELSGFIAAGKELETYWRDHYWLSAVNLNAWICNKYRTPYFLRTFFVTLEDVDDREVNIFWDSFTSLSADWHNHLFEKCKQGFVNGYYLNNKIALPTQIPAVSHTKCTYEYVKEVSHDLVTSKLFLDSLKKNNESTLGCYEEFQFNHTHIVDPFVRFEISRIYKLEETKECLMNILQLKWWSQKTSRQKQQLIKSYQKVVDGFFSINFDGKLPDIILLSLQERFSELCKTYGKDRPKQKVINAILDEFLSKLPNIIEA